MEETETPEGDKPAEETPAEETPTETAEETPSAPNSTLSMIERLEKLELNISEREKGIKEMLAKNEQIVSKMMMSGRAEAGGETKTPKQTAEEKMNAEVAATLERYS
ncbi:MAG: hypothetical protein CMI54_04260 [Parcubacteria group bacterium]|nr:hypothetical protein [Parcubacteria group bacterium]|tara:strand:+ start:5575 stop:5895 length:321 start_codon:yes stop_codon:yes gene_type:complete